MATNRSDPTIPIESIYAAVASRRAGFDQMAWQVPIISLTAQAFLFTLALGPDTSRTARLISAVLALLVTVLSMILMARHRQADVADGRWLAELEREGRLGDSQIAHSQPWRDRRNATSIWAGSPLELLKRAPAFKIWQAGLFMFALAALVVIAITLFVPTLLIPAAVHPPAPPG